MCPHAAGAERTDGMELPESIKKVLEPLENAGYESYVVGGTLRDLLLSRAVTSACDIMTAAQPEQTAELLRGRGLKPEISDDGCVTVFTGANGEKVNINRLPHDDDGSVKKIDEYLAQCDFTINAVAYSTATGIIDPFGGLNDISAGVIRTVLDARQSFAEHPLWMVRMARYRAQLSFGIDPQTMEAALQNKDLIKSLPPAELRDELFLLLCGDSAKRALLDCREIIFEIIPELRACDGFEQHNPNHSYDVYRHICETVGACRRNLVLRLAALLHDVAKPRCLKMRDDGRGTFPGHMELGETMAHEILTRLQCPTKMVSSVCSLVLYHDKPYLSTPAGARRWLSVLGRKNTLLLAELKRADCIAHSRKYHNRLARVGSFRHEINEALRRGDCYSLGTLRINSRILCDNLGVQQGRESGRILHRLLDEVIEGNVPNEQRELLALAEKIKSEQKKKED